MTDETRPAEPTTEGGAADTSAITEEKNGEAAKKLQETGISVALINPSAGN